MFNKDQKEKKIENLKKEINKLNNFIKFLNSKRKVGKYEYRKNSEN